MQCAVAYCRVSTEKAAQLDSYAAQKDFFVFYCQKHGYELSHIYGDEGKSGTRMATRPALLHLLQDAEAHRFELVLVKDVSRLARNVVDFLSAIRKLKALGIGIIFVNSDFSGSEGSEFILTLLSAVAQEESASLSRRIKFGKQLSAQQGRVPGFVFGYAHLDRFHLAPIPAEALLVRQIFEAYALEQKSLQTLAHELNRQGKTTRRGCKFTAKTVQRILDNPLYSGRLVCGKSEVADFLTGRRCALPQARQTVHLCPELRIVSDELFEKAQLQRRLTARNADKKTRQPPRKNCEMPPRSDV